MTSIERTIAEILAFLLLVSGFALYERHKGAEKCVAADKSAVQKQEAANAITATTDAQTINQEAKTYAAAQLDPIAAPVVRLRYTAPPALPRAPTAGPELACPSLPTADLAATVPGPDIGRPLVQIGHAADAQVEALWDYIDHVCRVKAP